MVTLFLLIVFGLLLGAGIKNRLEKAGLATENTGQRWWQVGGRSQRRLDYWTDTELDMDSTKANGRVWAVEI